MAKLSHLNARGEAVMVDVSRKTPTVREALAQGVVSMKPSLLADILDKGVAKGDVFGVARVAGIMAAKRTPELIPLCHPLPVSSVTIDFEPDAATGRVRVLCCARVEGKTGVEMEAMTGAAVACLTVYDMCKAADKGIEITDVLLLGKSGGKSGTWSRKAR